MHVVWLQVDVSFYQVFRRKGRSVGRCIKGVFTTPITNQTDIGVTTPLLRGSRRSSSMSPPVRRRWMTLLVSPKHDIMIPLYRYVANLCSGGCEGGGDGSLTDVDMTIVSSTATIVAAPDQPSLRKVERVRSQREKGPCVE